MTVIASAVIGLLEFLDGLIFFLFFLYKSDVVNSLHTLEGCHLFERVFRDGKSAKESKERTFFTL